MYWNTMRSPGETMRLGRLRHQRGFVEAREDQLQLARIGVDVADGEDAGHRGLELLGVDRDQVVVELEPPVGDRAELHGQAEERQQRVAGIECLLARRP